MTDIQIDNSSDVVQLPAYKVYIARISQTGTDAPVAVVLQNTIGTINWIRSAPGNYAAQSPDGLFTNNKTVCLPFGDAANGSVFGILSADTVGYYQMNGGSEPTLVGLNTFSDLVYTSVEWSSIGGNLTVEIRVYP